LIKAGKEKEKTRGKGVNKSFQRIEVGIALE
jgi:hypothetical protein